MVVRRCVLVFHTPGGRRDDSHTPGMLQGASLVYRERGSTLEGCAKELKINKMLSAMQVQPKVEV